MFLFLLIIGFTFLGKRVLRSNGVRAINGLPWRPTAGQEWLRGAALGWALPLLAVLPVVFTANLHPQLWLAPRSWGLCVVSLATLALGTLALEVAYRGFLFTRLIDAIGPIAATILLSLIYAIASTFQPNSTSLSVAVTFLLGVLFAFAYLRTHALWLGWGLHFAWSATTAVLLGLPIAGSVTDNTLVATSVTGPDWLTGGAYGPEGAAVTVVVVLLGWIILHRITRNYAWEYTHPPIVAAGYPMDVAPPAAHVAMEDAVARNVPLVQILPTTSANPSTLPAIEEHIRAAQEAATQDPDHES